MRRTRWPRSCSCSPPTTWMRWWRWRGGGPPRAPGRADLHKLQGDVATKVGDKQGALAAYRAALELDPGYVQVCVDLARLHEEKEDWSAAQQAYERALDALPTFHEAALALADLLRRTGRARQAVVRLAEMLEQDPYDR